MNAKKDKSTSSSETIQKTPEVAAIPEDEIDRIIRNRVYASMTLGLAPIPLVDLVGLTAIQIDVVRALAKRYDVPFKKNAAKTIITALVGGILPVGTAPLFASVMKVVPFVGLTTGAVSMSLLGGASTYAVGRVFNKHFASGGTLINMDAEKIRKGFKEQYEKGKEYVSSLRKKKETSVQETKSKETSETAAEPTTV